jgi:hypothetical protein
MLALKCAVFVEVKRWDKARNVALLSSGRYIWARNRTRHKCYRPKFDVCFVLHEEPSYEVDILGSVLM